MKRLLALTLTILAVSAPTAAIAHPVRVDYVVTPLQCAGYLVVNRETGYIHHETNCLG